MMNKEQGLRNEKDEMLNDDDNRVMPRAAMPENAFYHFHHSPFIIQH
jgi:hypothetical protein